MIVCRPELSAYGEQLQNSVSRVYNNPVPESSKEREGGHEHAEFTLFAKLAAPNSYAQHTL